MKLYVINLDRSPERLQRLRDVFSAMGLSFQRVVAVDGKNLDDAFLQDMAQGQLWQQPLTRGEIACFLSHKSALQMVAEGDDDYGAIFEDDVAFSETAASFLSSCEWIPKGGDIIKLETHGKKVWLGPPQACGHGFSVARLKSRHIMAAAYIVSKTAARKLLADMDRVSAPFDHFLFNPTYGIFAKFEIWQLDPAIVVQAGLQSTLETDRSSLEKQKKQKRKVLQTICREVKRIFSRTKTGIWGIYINVFTRDQWKRVRHDQ
ncbi:glycosyltransferase family 25 protein [Bartonella sp. LJL80]